MFKIWGTGHQKYNINETEVEKQIKNELTKYIIDENFLHWTLEVMKDNNVIEVRTEEDIKGSVMKTLDGKQEELKKKGYKNR